MLAVGMPSSRPRASPRTTGPSSWKGAPSSAPAAATSPAATSSGSCSRRPASPSCSTSATTSVSNSGRRAQQRRVAGAPVAEAEVRAHAHLPGAERAGEHLVAEVLRAQLRESSAVKGITTISSTPSAATRSIFSVGGGQQLRRLAGAQHPQRMRVEGHHRRAWRRCARGPVGAAAITCRWPRCTPSKVPSATARRTAPAGSRERPVDVHGPGVRRCGHSSAGARLAGESSPSRLHATGAAASARSRPGGGARSAARPRRRSRPRTTTFRPRGHLGTVVQNSGLPAAGSAAQAARSLRWISARVRVTAGSSGSIAGRAARAGSRTGSPASADAAGLAAPGTRRRASARSGPRARRRRPAHPARPAGPGTGACRRRTGPGSAGGRRARCARWRSAPCGRPPGRAWRSSRSRVAEEALPQELPAQRAPAREVHRRLGEGGRRQPGRVVDARVGDHRVRARERFDVLHARIELAHQLRLRRRRRQQRQQRRDQRATTR